MFGHKDGKVELKLKEILRVVGEAEDRIVEKINHKQIQGDTGHLVIRLRTIKYETKELLKLSDEIHKLVKLI